MRTLIAICMAAHFGAAALAQSNQTDTARWLAKADLAPPFVVPATREAWEAKRPEVRAELWRLLGRLPPRPAVPKVETLSREDRGDYIVEKFQFDNDAGATVPGYLLLPKKTSAKLPAILYCHWHGGDYDIGKEELFQARHTPEAPGPALAKRGYVVLAIDAYCFGERHGRGPDGPAEKNYTEEETSSKFNLWVGRTFWGMLLRDDLMALDYLASRPEVDPGRIAVTGMSMGATRTWWLMALDERIKTGVAICCLTRYQNMIEHQALHEHDIGYFVPDMLNHFDTEAVVALIAPRPVLFQNGDQDKGSPADGIRAIELAARPAYRLYGKETELESVIYPGQGHLYTPKMWAKTLAWMDEHLGNLPGSTNEVSAQPQAAMKPARCDQAPRKVLMGTVVSGEAVFSLSLEQRLRKMDDVVEAIAAQAGSNYPGKQLDLVVLPEAFLARPGGSLAQKTVRLEEVEPRMAACARRYHCYLVVPLFLREAGTLPRYSNVAVLVDREGRVAGIYRKVHLVAPQGSDVLEEGMTPGRLFPVFDCDFGRLGIQICFDMMYTDGWQMLADQGAEIVALPSANPDVVHPAAYAMQHEYYIVSSTPRDHAAVIGPLGIIEAQASGNGAVLVQQIDLSYALLHWDARLEDGKALSRKFGDKVGYHYYRPADMGIFWSNDPGRPIGQMIRSLGLSETDVELERIRALQEKVRGGPPSMP